MATAPKGQKPQEVVVSLPTLHPGQVRIREAITAKKSRFVTIMCGRQWGKTTDGIEWLADGALEGHPCAWMAPNYKYLSEAWREITTRLRPAAKSISEQEHRIELIGGGVIECWTMDTPDPGRSRRYKRVVIDEAGLVRDLVAVWNGAIRPTLVRLKGDCRFYGTPKGRLHGFNVLFAKGEQGEEGWAAFRAFTSENPYIPKSEIELARRSMPADDFAREFEGMPSDDTANPFGAAAIKLCIKPLSTKKPVVWGWDFARAQDWYVGIALDEAGDVCRFERWQHTPWGVSRLRVAEMVGFGMLCVGDSTGIGDAVVESIQALRIAMEGYAFTPKSKQQLMERLAGAIQSQTIGFPDGVIRSELDTFEYEYTAHGVRYSAPGELHDDAVMALALAVYGWDTYGFAAKYQRAEMQKARDAAVVPRRSMGYDFALGKPRERMTADEEMDRIFENAQQDSPLAGRYELPRDR